MSLFPFSGYGEDLKREQEIEKEIKRRVCSNCGGRFEFKERINYCNSSDENPVIYRCNRCGKLKTLWD